MASPVIALLLLCHVQHAHADPVMRRSSAESKRQPLMRSQKETFKDTTNNTTRARPAQRFRPPIFASFEEIELAELKEEAGDCGLAPWSTWSICSQCGGQRVRTREALGVLAEFQVSGAELRQRRSDLDLKFRPGDEVVRWSGELLIKRPGRYTFQAHGVHGLQVGAALRVGPKASKRPGEPGGEWVRWLAKGAHSLLVEAVPNENAPLKYKGPDTLGELMAIPTAALRHGVHDDCKSRSVEAQACKASLGQGMAKACSVDCAWSDWADWLPCSKTCGPGSTSRSRSVAMRALEQGRACEGQASEQRSCHVPCGFW